MGVSELIIGNQNKDEMLYRAIVNTIKLYSDPSHFVFELMQNAEDAGATKMKFIMKQDMLVLLHDGIPFSQSNLSSLCDIGNSDKLNKPNKIGEFGVGFKSVFAICKDVNVYCDSTRYSGCENVLEPFGIQIQNFTNPKDIPRKNIDAGYTTMYEFPYVVGERYSGYRDLAELRAGITECLKGLGYQTLLFLRNLTEISYEISTRFETVSKVFSIVKKPYTDKAVIAYADDISSELKNGYLIYSEEAPNAKGHTIDVAYYVKLKGNEVVSFEHGMRPYTVSVYFPTNHESKLPFLVQGPFSTTSNRAEVARCKENSELADAVTQLFLSSLEDIKANGLLDLSLLDVLADIDKHNLAPTALFFRLKRDFIDFLKTREFVPAINGFVKGSNARLMRGKWLCSAFDDDALSLLIDPSGSQYYKRLSPEITTTGLYGTLHRFLNKTIGAREISPNDLPDMFNRNPHFYEEMGMPWQINLLKEMQATPNLFDKKSDRTMVDIPFVLTSTGEYVKPFLYKGTEKINNVFLSKGKSCGRKDMFFVHDAFYRELKDFFDHTLKITTPDTDDIFIDHLKRSYGRDNVIVSDECYREDMLKLLEYLEVPGMYDKMKNFLSELKIIYVKKPGESKSHLDSLSKTQPYQPFSEEGIFIESYLSGISNVPYVVDQMKYVGFDKIIKYLTTRNSLVFGQTYREYRNTDEYGCLIDMGDFCSQLDFYKSDEVLKFIEKHPGIPESRIKSADLMKLAMHYSRNLTGDSNACNTGEIIHCDSKILQKLKQKSWVYAENGDVRVPCSLDFDLIDHSLYHGLTKDSSLVDLLGFKISPTEKIMKQIEDVPETTKREVLGRLLYDVLGVQLSNIEKNTQLKSIDFPESSVRNKDRMILKVREKYLRSRKVEYMVERRQVRVSANVSEDRDFINSVYMNIHEKCCVCQMCGCRTKHPEVTQLQHKAEREISELNLSLCPDCHQEYILSRNKDGFDEALKDAIENWNLGDEPVLKFKNLKVRFTENHLYQIKLFFENLYPELKKVVEVKPVEQIVSALPVETDQPNIKVASTAENLPKEIKGTINEIYRTLNFFPFFIEPVYSANKEIIRVNKIERSGHIIMAEGYRKIGEKVFPWNHSADNDKFIWRRKK